jgi:hypothetical protein
MLPSPFAGGVEGYNKKLESPVQALAEPFCIIAE